MDGLGKPFAHRLTAMIKSGLLTPEEYMRWADALIALGEKPPNWILDMATAKDPAVAVEQVSLFAHTEPFVELSVDSWVDDYVASLYLRHERRALKWERLLAQAGEVIDGLGGREVRFAPFYSYLDAFEASQASPELERAQRHAIETGYRDVIGSVRRVLDAIAMNSR